MNPIKIICVILGFIFFGLGATGAFLPVLPTTPFLLLAAFFFAKGSTRFNTWFTSTKLYQNYASSFLKHRSMTLKVKIGICALATTMLLISFFLVDVIFVRVFILGLIIFMFYYFIFRIKTISPEEDAAIKATDTAEREAQTKAPVTLRETLEDVRSMHEEMYEEGLSKDTSHKTQDEESL